MEIVGQPSPSGACNLLGVPGLSSLDVDDDEGEVVIGIRPKSSPLPRRRSSDTDDDSDLEPPPSGSRRVSFADARGLSLVQVREFDTWDVPKLPGYESSEGEGNDAEEYFLSPLTFPLRLPTEELFVNVREHKAELETLELLPGTTILKGVIRVLNISFDKAVYIRTTLDSWSTHFDLLAEYVPDSSDGVTDCFSFRLTLVPPFEAQGARVDFCLRYETSMGTFWANNNDRNYVFSCQHRKKEERKEPLKGNMTKSCLKTVSQNFSAVESSSTNGDPSEENNSTDVSTNVQKVQTIPSSQTCEDQSGTSEGREQTLMMENRNNRSRKSRRKAARLARVRHYFAQRGAEGNDSERDESPPGSSQAAAEKVPEEKQTVAKPESKRNQAGGSPIISDSLKGKSELLQDDASPSHDCESVKPESIRRVDSDLESGGHPEVKDKLLPLDNEPKQPNINETVTESEEIKPDRDVGDELSNNEVDLSNENLVSQAECFTFGTVVAPLYQQVFGRGGSDSQRKADWGNPAWAAVMDEDSNPPTERGQNNCTDPTEATSKNSKVETSVEANHTTIDPTLNDDPHEDQTSLNVAVNGVVDCQETLAEIEEQEDKRASHVSKPVPGDSCGLLQTGNILSDKNLLNSQKPPEIKHLQGEVVEEEEILDLRSQTTAERRQHQMPKNTDAPTVTDNDESHEVKMSLRSSVVPSRPLQSVSEQNIEETNQQTNTRGEKNYKSTDLNETRYCCSTVISSKTSLIDDRFVDVIHDLNSKETVLDETVSPCVSASELVEEKDLTTLEKFVGTHRETNNLEKGNEEVCSSNRDEINPSDDIKLLGEVDETMTDTDEIHEDVDVVLVMCEDKHTINEDSAMETAESKQDENLTDDTAVQNWEAMVEEEENDIILSEEENETQSIKTEDFKQIEKVTTEEKNKATEEEFVGEITFVGVKEEEEVRSEEKEWIETEETVGAEEKQSVKILSDCLQITKTVRTAGEEKPADVEKTEEPEEKEKSCDKSYNNGFLEELNFPKDQDIDVKEETEMNSNNKVVAGMQWEDQVEPKEKNDEQESPYYKEEMVVVDGLHGVNSHTPLEDGEADVESDKEEEEALDITINTIEGGQKVVIEKEYKEVKNEQIQNDTFLHEEEKEFQTDSDLTKAESNFTAADWTASFLTDEPENDQTDQDGVSTESDSDDEVELYMHCLRAVSAGAQAQKDRDNDTGFSAGKRPSISRSKRLSTPMPSISESMDEEQQLGGLLESPEDAGAPSASTSASALTTSSGQEGVCPNIASWKDTFSCSNISKTLLYTTLLVVFLVVAYYYDFLACFVLYFISVVWLYCQGERQPAKNNNRVG